MLMSINGGAHGASIDPVTPLAPVNQRASSRLAFGESLGESRTAHGPNRRMDRRMDMLLEQKTAVIYGAGGAIGSAVARAFAREGARVYLAGRTRPPPGARARRIP